MAVNTWDVQSALSALLKTDPALNDLVNGRISDRRNQKVLFPHVVFGPDVVTDDRTSDGDGLEIVATIDIWSEYDGFKEVKQIRHAIRAAVDRQNLTVAGLSSCIAFDDGGPNILDPDGKRRHGVMRVRLICRE